MAQQTNKSEDLKKSFTSASRAHSQKMSPLLKDKKRNKSVIGKSRPCRIEPDALRKASNWMSEYRQFWEESFDRLDTYLKTMVQKKKIKSKGKKHGRKK